MKNKNLLVFILLISFFFCSPTALATTYIEQLNSDWNFYEKSFLTTTSESKENGKIVNLPIEFENLNLDKNTYGTFIKVVKIPEEQVNSQLGFELPFVYSAAKVYINGTFMQEVGEVGTSRSTHKTNLKSVIIPFKPTSTEIEITIQLSSFDHIRGGFSEAPSIGEWDQIENDFLLERYVTIFIGTIIFTVGLATLTIGLMNRNEKLFFVFGLFSMDVAIRSLFAVPFLYHELPFSISYEMATKLEYITTSTCFALYAVFIYLLYNKLFSKYVLYFNVTILVSIAILACLTKPEIFQSAFFSVFPFMLLFVAYNIWIMCKALKSNLTLAKPLLLGVLFVFTGLILDFLSGMGLLNMPPLAHFMIALNVLIVLFSLCKKYVKRVAEVTILNNKLDELVKERTIQLNLANEALKKQINIDALTGIYNRHKFNETIYLAFNEAERKKQHLGLMMLDIDEFKCYNDYYGHVSGDELLIRIAAIIKANCPEDVTLARYGGEEFAIILPNYTLTQTTVLAEQIRKNIEEHQIENLGRENKRVTISIGCAEVLVDSIKNEKMLMEVADERLYMSKMNGRNRVTDRSIKSATI